jgi:hypothetical protein
MTSLASKKAEVDADIAKVVDLCRGLFQSDCIEFSKTEVGRRVVVIGYAIDSDLGVVSVDLLKVVYGLSSVDFNSKVTIKLMQRFAGHVLYELDVVAKRAVQMFRALFLVAMGNEERFARSLGSFVAVYPSVVVEFDASLEGRGVMVFGV